MTYQPAVAPVIKHLDQAMLTSYAAASGDFNPVHIDPEFARTTPFGGTIAHGMLVLAFISEMMMAAFPILWVEGGALDVRFRHPARPGDVVTARATPAKTESGIYKYNVACLNQNGEVLISGTAQVPIR